MNTTKPKLTLKQKFLHEFKEYWVNFIYMGLYFSAIIYYRRQLLATYDIELNDYFFGIIKAAIIAKVVIIAGLIPWVRMFDHKPLIIPVLYKGMFFTLFVMFFDLLEEAVRTAIRNPDVAEVWLAIQERPSPIWFAMAILIFFSFIPYFGFKEMVRVMGSVKIKALFLEGSAVEKQAN